MTVWEAVTPLVDEPELRTYWEPQTFKVGDRVRVRITRECPKFVGTGDGTSGVGTIFDIDRGTDHPYLVASGPAGSNIFYFGWCAAIELELEP